MSTPTTVFGFLSRHQELSKQLTALQIQHENLHASNARHYHLLVEESIQGLFDVIRYVKKADKSLVEWHSRSPGLKRALRFFGIDRRTTTVVEKKTQKLKAKVSVVESNFDSAEHAVTTGLHATEKLKTEFVRFSQHSVDPVSKQMQEAHSDLNDNHEQIVHQIGQQRHEQSTAKVQMQEASESLERTRAERETTERARTILTAGALLGFGAAAISAVAFPPSLAFTASALVVGTRAGALAHQANEDANKLQAEQKHLTAALSSHEHSIEALESELSCLDTSRHDHAEAIALLEKLQAQTSRFRANVQENLDQARNTKLYLNKTKLKLADIIQKLHECQYEETRRGIAARLREVLTMIQSGPSQKMTTSGPEKVRKAMEYLIEIDQRTVQVVDILTMH